MIKSGIYLIQNKLSNKIYIGSAVNIEKRFYEHIWALNKRCHRNTYLQRAWIKDGQNNFSFEIYLQCEIKDLILFEQTIIDTLSQKYGWNNLYNLSPTAGSTLGKKHSEETKIKIGIKSKGRWTGKHHTKETRDKMSKAQKGRIITPEARKKMSIARKGKKLPPFTEEHKRKIGLASMGRKKFPEEIEKLRIANTGRILSVDTRRKIGDAFRGKPGTRLGIKNKKPYPKRKTS